MQRYFGRIVERQAVLQEDDVFHLTRVMRAKVGEQIEVVEDGVVYLCQISRFKPLIIDVIRRLRENNELPNRIILVASLLKGEKMDLVLQKATELGVDEVVLLETSRTVVKFKKDDRDVKIERFNRILKEAAEQSKRNRIPHLYRIIDFNTLHDIEADIKMVAYEGEAGSTNSFNKIVESIEPEDKVAVLIGPEGGFSDHEILLATKQGFRKVSLGKRILRAETAAFYALSVIANYLEKK